jgi:hypothetical protein
MEQPGVFGVLAARSGIPGPTVVKQWSGSAMCSGDITAATEIFSFGTTVQEAPHRQPLPPVGNVLPPVLARLANTNEYALLGESLQGLSPSRLGADGLVWQQSAFVADWYDGVNWPIGSNLKVSPNGNVLAFGWFDSRFHGDDSTEMGPSGDPQPFQVELNWTTGEVISRTLLPIYTDVLTATWDAQNRLVVAHPTQEGEIVWSRLSGTSVSSVTLVRTTFTLMPVDLLGADTVGGTYLLTKTGDRGSSIPTLCRMNEAQEVACVLVGDAISVTELHVSDLPGVVYLTSEAHDGTTTLNRYDFPL